MRGAGVALALLFLVASVFALHPFAAERAFFTAAANLGAPHAALLLPLTRLGNFIVLAPLTLGVALWLIVGRRSALAVWLVATTLGARLLVEALKLAFARPRPDLLPRLDHVVTASFPSAHAANSMATFLAVAMALRLPVWPAVLVALLIGVSRVLLAVHWPSDVAAGWAFGALVVILAARWLPGRTA